MAPGGRRLQPAAAAVQRGGCGLAACGRARQRRKLMMEVLTVCGGISDPTCGGTQTQKGAPWEPAQCLDGLSAPPEHRSCKRSVWLLGGLLYLCGNVYAIVCAARGARRHAHRPKTNGPTLESLGPQSRVSHRLLVCQTSFEDHAPSGSSGCRSFPTSIGVAGRPAAGGQHGMKGALSGHRPGGQRPR
jgi:hypothetical protein